MELIIHVLDIFAELIGFICSIIIFLTLSAFIEPRKHWILKLLAIILLRETAMSIIYLNDPVNISASLLLFIVYMTIFHKGKWIKKITAVFIFYPMCIAVNFLQQNVFSDFFFAVSGASSPSTNWPIETLLFSTVLWLCSHVTRLLFWIGALLFLRKYNYLLISEKISRHTWLIADSMMGISVIAVYTSILFVSYNNLVVYPLCIVTIIAGFGGIALVAYMSRSEQIAIEARRLQMQHAYYLEKLKDEERVRAAYHDMKNHLLILKQQGNSAETAQTIEKLQAQIIQYEDYVHTGNDILDIILKEKSRQARETQIDLSVVADFTGIDFMESLDISTIFGNGLDNAIEAASKLSREHRVILLKAGKVQNFLSILIENNCNEENRPPKGGTTKQDKFFHGFGIMNMQKAAEKYGGQLNASYLDGKFFLKILIPIP